MTQSYISIRVRRDTANNWAINNPVLKVGEPGLETDTRKLKFGDGVSTWTNLQYSSGININDPILIESIDDRVSALIKAGSNISLSYNDAAGELTIGATGLQLAGDYATLVNGKIPAIQLPSYVDDVLEFANLAALPASGETNKIYVTLDSNKTYRWSGSAYVEISASPGSTDAVPEGSTNKYYTDARASAAAPVQSVAGRIGAVTLGKSDVGLGNVDNTSDANKPISTATQTALDTKAPTNNPTFTGTVSGVTKSMVGLGNVDNTSDANKPISTATQTALDGKANSNHNHDDRYYTETEINSLLSSKISSSVPWTANHTLVDGTRYLAGDVVYNNGNIYRAKFDNESLPTSDTTYWENLGPGYRINIDGRDIPNIPYPVTSVNGLTGSVTIDSANTGDIVFNNSTISTSDENGNISINVGENNTWTFYSDGLTMLPGNISAHLDVNIFANSPELGHGRSIALIAGDGTGEDTDGGFIGFRCGFGDQGGQDGRIQFEIPKRINNGQNAGFDFFIIGNSDTLNANGDTIPQIRLPNNSSVSVGSFENGTGGNGGISLNCVVGYELNWQGGRLKSTYNNGESAAPIFVDSPMSAPPVVLESASNSNTINTNAKDGDIFDITLTENSTLANPTNPVNGKTIRWRITQDGTGNRTVTLGSKFNLPSSATSPLPWSTAANKMDVLAATYHVGRDKWDVVAFVPGY